MERRFHLAAKVCAGTTFGLGTVVLVGWAINVPFLVSIHPSLASMKANTALLFILIGTAIWLTASNTAPRVRSALSVLVVSVAGMTLIEYGLNTGLGIDELLFRDTGGPGSAAPGRMAGATAVCFVLLGLAASPSGRLRSAKTVGVWLSGAIALVSLAGYLYNAQSLYAVTPFGSIALHTTIGFLFSSAGFLAADIPNGSLPAVLASDTNTGRLLRWMLPIVLALPLAVGWLRLLGQRMGLYDTNFGVAVLVVSMIGSLGVSIWIVSRSLYESELAAIADRAALKDRGRELSAALLASQQSDARHQAVVSSALDAVVSMDDTGAIVEFNPAAERMFGYRRNDVLHRLFADVIVPPALRDAHERALAQYLETGQGSFLGRIVELSAVRSDGSEFPVEIGIARVSGQTPPLFTAFIRDITERKRSSERFRLAIEAAPAGMVLVDSAGTIVLVNSQIEKLFGYRREELIGQSVGTLVPERIAHMLAVHRLGSHADPKARPMGEGELYGVRKDGKEMPIEVGLNPLSTADGAFVLASITDMTERYEAQRDNDTLMRQLHRLAGRLIAARETEQARIARDLHDDVSQQLAGLAIAMSNLRRRVGALLPHDEQLARDVSSLQARVIDVAESVRQVSRDLHPGLIKHSGLVAALSAHCDELANLRTVTVSFSTSGDFEDVDKETALCLYRVAQEALRNVFAHARARHADVRLVRIDNSAEITIADDGQGFDLAETRRLGRGLGLLSLTERVGLAGGTISISTQPHEGTRVLVRIPIRPSRVTDTGGAATRELGE